MKSVQSITAVLSTQLIDTRRRRDAERERTMLMKQRRNAKQLDKGTSFADILASAMTE